MFFLVNKSAWTVDAYNSKQDGVFLCVFNDCELAENSLHPDANHSIAYVENRIAVVNF